MVYREEVVHSTRGDVGGGLLPLLYIVIGAFVAGVHRYFSRVDELEGIASALLAMFLWPLVLLGVDLRIG